MQRTGKRPVPNPNEPWRIAALPPDFLPPPELSQKRFIIVPGIERCGTTAFHAFMQGAAAVALPHPKEIEFFSSNFNAGFDWYFSRYDAQKNILLDATPSYHWSNAALWRIRECCNDVLMVLMLRDPVARAYSAYCHRLNWFFLADFTTGRNLESYEMSITDFAHVTADGFPGFNFIFVSYRQAIDRILGEYNAGFGEWQFLPVVLERFIADPAAVVGQIEQRLDAELGLPPDCRVPKVNSATFPRFYLGNELLAIHGAERLGLDAKSAYICLNGVLNRIGDAEVYPYLKRLQQKWLEPLTIEAAEFIFSRFYEHELWEVERRVGLRLDEWRQVKPSLPKLSRTPFEFVARSRGAAADA